MAEGLGLVIKVLQVTGIPSSAENEASDVYCILSTGTCRFTCRSLPAKRNSTPWPESFLLSPADIKHASQRITPSSTKIPSGADVTAAATAEANFPTSTAGSSPVLSIELWSSKRWGADAMTASGELLLAPYLSTLQPGGPAVQARVALKNPKANSIAANKAGRSGMPAAAGASTSSSPGLESGWVLGAEVQCMVVELVAVAPPTLPVNLLGPVGSGQTEVPPSYSCSTSWLSAQRPTLHTSAGHLYQTPTVQMLKITLHRAQGLQNLHVDPHAAAAAAAAISKLSVVGEAPTRAERARIAATAVLESKVGRSLVNKTNRWFNRNKPPPLAVVGSAVAATGAITQDSRSQTPLAANPSAALAGATAAAADSSGGAAFGGSPALPLSVSAAGPLTRQDSPRLTPTPAAAAGGKDSPQAAAAAAAAAQAAPVAASPYTSVADAVDSTSNLPRSASPAVGVPPDAAAGTVVASVVDDDGVELLANDLIAVDTAAEEADPDFDLDEDEFSLEDPVSRLQQATQHRRKASVDAEAVMAALEENGFHATDAPGGAYVYARLNVSPDGDTLLSRVVGLRAASGEAVWEQSFWVAVTRPAPAGSSLEVELFASKDDKSRGRSVAVVRVPLHQLLQQPQQSSKAGSQAEPDGSSSTASAWFRASHSLPASISDHLHCSVHVTVEAADWDSRAELVHIPRAIQPDAISTGEPGSLAYQQRLLGSSSPGSGTSSPRGSPRKAASSKLLAQHTNLSAGLERTGSPVPGLQQQQRQDSMGSNAGSVQGGASARITHDLQETVAVTAPPDIAKLDVVVKAFETRKPLDVFFVLLIGPHCLVSSTSHSTHHHSWGWHLNMEVTEPADMITLALFAREDQAGGKKKVGASMLTMFSSSIRLVGKMRVRLSTLTANTPMNVSMPLQGERTNLRAGRPAAAVAHLYLHLQVPQLFGTYLRSYFKYTASSPGLYLLANKRGSDSHINAQDSSLDVLAMQAEQTTARWFESQPPSLPWKVFRKVQDDGRLEFTLSRTRSNWRRLILLRESLAPARAMFDHLCSWENYLHSGACYCIILLFGMYPSKVLAVLLLWICIAIARAAAANSKGSNTQLSSGKQPTSSSQASAAAAVITAPPSAVTAPGPPSAAGGLPGVFQCVMPARPPPNMTDPGLLTAEEQQQQLQQQQGSVVVTDSYTSLKQNYEGLVLFLTTVQNVVDGWAAAGERIQFAFTWSDQLATTVLLVVLLVLAVGLWVLGLRVLVTIGLLWVFRHPVLRDPLPPPPANFVARMPTRSDTMM